MQDFLRILKNFLLALNTPFFSYLSALPRSAQISEKSRKYKICRGYLPVLSVVPQPAFLPSFQMPAASSSTPGSCCFPAGQSRAPSSARRFVRFSVDRKTAVRKSSETDIPQMQSQRCCASWFSWRTVNSSACGSSSISLCRPAIG